MKKKILVAAAVAALSLAGCSGNAQAQTGGGSAGGSSQSAAPATTQATVKPLTVADVVSQGWLAGTAKPTFPAGTPGKTDVVASAPIVPSQMGTTVAFAVRNNTSSPVTEVDVTAAAKDASGKILASGRSQGLAPQTIPVGGIGLGYVYFASDTKIAADSKLSFTVASQPVAGTPYKQDLKMDQASTSGQNIVGQATNVSKQKLNGPYPVTLTCFDAKGGLLSSQIGFAEPGADLADGQSVTFQIGLFDKQCPSFLVGVGGYGKLS